MGGPAGSNSGGGGVRGGGGIVSSGVDVRENAPVMGRANNYNLVE